MTRYRIPDFANLVQAYQQAIAQHLTRTAADTSDAVGEHATFDQAWFSQTLRDSPEIRPLLMTICDETDQNSYNDASD